MIFLKKHLLWVLFFLFVIIRLPYLDQLNLLHDERDIVLSGYSIAKTGQDLYKNTAPLNFKNINPNNPLFAIYYSSVWSFINPLRSVFYARFPFVLVSGLLIFLVYELIKIITKDRQKALLTTVVLCFSPWIYHITRLALDIPLALVFLICGTCLYLKKNRLSAYLFFILTAYTYQGFKLLVPFLVVYLELFFYLKEKNFVKFIKKNCLNLIFIILLFSSGFLIESDLTKNRLKEIVFFNPKKTSEEVIFRRNTSTASTVVKSIFDNKLTAAFDYILINFIKGQDLSYLFKEGESTAINSNIASGQFLLIIIIFYYFGIMSLGKKSTKEDYYIIGFSVVGMVPSLLSALGVSFSIRSAFSAVGFSYLIGLGLIYGKQAIYKLKKSRLVIATILMIFIINLAYFVYIYFNRRPILVGEIYNENERQISKYLLNKPGRTLTIYDPQPQDLYLSLVFFDNKETVKNLQNNLEKGQPFLWKQYKIQRCDHTLDYLAMTNALINERCLDKELYDHFNDEANINIEERIYYQDYSTRTAYFITR